MECSWRSDGHWKPWLDLKFHLISDTGVFFSPLDGDRSKSLWSCVEAFMSREAGGGGLMTKQYYWDWVEVVGVHLDKITLVWRIPAWVLSPDVTRGAALLHTIVILVIIRRNNQMMYKMLNRETWEVLQLFFEAQFQRYLYMKSFRVTPTETCGEQQRQAWGQSHVEKLVHMSILVCLPAWQWGL